MPGIEEVASNLTNHYTHQVVFSFDDMKVASKAAKSLEVFAITVKELYRYFEPSFFNGDFYVCVEFDDNYCLNEEEGTLLWDKNILLNKTEGIVIVQVLDGGKKIHLWEKTDLVKESMTSLANTLVYHYFNNKEQFYANGKTIDITIYDQGSRFATQFIEIVKALNDFAIGKIYHSSCAHFSSSWALPKDKKLFFRGGGSGSNIPEKFMQLSLYEYMNTLFTRGINIDSSREYNLNGDFSKPKPVDLRIHWREANRTVLIEVKFMGTIKKDSDGEIHIYSDANANKGLVQLKGYHDAAKQDSPRTIIKSYLVVIDGRRNNLTKDSVSISTTDGMHYKNEVIQVDDNKKYYETILGFEKPMKMFTAPVCE